MRRVIKLPRILKINQIKGMEISVVFNNGESRIIDFNKLLVKFKVNKDHPAYILHDPKEFKKAKIENNTLSWSNVKQYVTVKDGKKIPVPFEIGADVLLRYSKPDHLDKIIKLGKIIKENRESAGLTQEDLAILSGTTKTYISRVENDKTAIQIDTLQKIVEIGLRKQLEIKIK